jgi:hypothetical protein
MEAVLQIPQPDVNSERQQSTIEFAYTDLDGAIEVASGVHRGGGPSCEYEQLAAELHSEAKGGHFRLKVSGARLFGLVSHERGGRVSLTDLGRQIIDPLRSRQARVAAFLNVPLYQKVYEQFKGSLLPPTPGLERAIESMGVGTKVKERARQVMLRSAKQAGFFEHTPDRMVKPSLRLDGDDQPSIHGNSSPSAQSLDQGGGATTGSAQVGGSGGGGGGGRQHPLIQGLLMTLPEPGKEWTAQERVNWLTMAASIFKMIYTDSAPSNIQISNNSGGATSAT